MTTNRKKLDGPVRSGRWGLAVDTVAAPRTVIVLQFSDASRHTRSSLALGTVGYLDDPAELVAAVVESAPVPAPAAAALVRDLLAKVNSPRARAVDTDGLSGGPSDG